MKDIETIKQIVLLDQYLQTLYRLNEPLCNYNNEINDVKKELDKLLGDN